MKSILILSLILSAQIAKSDQTSTECYGKIDGQSTVISAERHVNDLKYEDVIVGEDPKTDTRPGVVRVGTKTLVNPQVFTLSIPKVDRSIVDSVDVCEDGAGVSGKSWSPIAESEVVLFVSAWNLVGSKPGVFKCVDYTVVDVTCK